MDFMDSVDKGDAMDDAKSEPRKTPAVEEAVATLERRISRLRDVVGKLEDRLAPVLSPGEAKEAESPPAQPDPPASPMCVTLGVLHDRLRADVRRLMDLERRLEV